MIVTVIAARAANSSQASSELGREWMVILFVPRKGAHDSLTAAGPGPGPGAAPRDLRPGPQPDSQ